MNEEIHVGNSHDEDENATERNLVEQESVAVLELGRHQSLGRVEQTLADFGDEIVVDEVLIMSVIPTDVPEDVGQSAVVRAQTY